MNRISRIIVFLACLVLLWQLVNSFFPFSLLGFLISGFLFFGLSWRLIADFYDVNYIKNSMKWSRFEEISRIDFGEDFITAFVGDSDKVVLPTNDIDHSNYYLNRWGMLFFKQQDTLLAFDKFTGKMYFVTNF